MMLYNRAMEAIAPEALAALQGERLAALVARVYERVPFYRARLDEAGVAPADIRRAADVVRLPFTRKTDLRDHYPFGLFAVPVAETARLHASSGTTGKPTVVGYTAADLAVWAEVCARALACCGGRAGDMFQNAYGYGLFTGGLGMHYGAERLGMSVIPVSGGNTTRQIMLLQDFGTTVMACTPSYALTLAERLHAEGIDPASLKLRTLVLGAEPWTEAMRAAIEARLPVDAVNIYGLSEIIGPGVSNECVEARDGSHVFEDHFLVEAVDPERGTPVPDGEVGELVFTTLTKEAMPLLRYRTGDLASLNRAPCICGRTLVRHSRIVGRTDDMLIIKGVNVFPSQIEAALMGEPALSPHHRIVLTGTGSGTVVEVRVEPRPGAGIAAGDAALTRAVTARLKDALGLNVRVTVAEPGSLPRSEGGKLSRVDDRRG